jgi:pimeloyl-ACP methyl ester carboxylesterase
LIFGYNSNVAFNVSQKGFRHHADRLLECLSISRREAEANNRPIIFIGHSLGGLIIKQALVTANNNHRKYGDIRHSTKGLVFFGTPHRGGNGAKFGNRVTNVVADMTGIESNDLLTYLDPDSPLAQNVHEDFSHQLPDYRCVSFFETLPTKLPFFPLQKIIVDSDSAQLGASLVNEKVIGLDFDHRNMCKLGAADENYFKVVGPIMELVKHCQEEAAIHSLAVKAPTFWQRLENLVSPTPHHMPCVSCKRYHCGRTGCI